MDLTQLCHDCKTRDFTTTMTRIKGDYYCNNCAFKYPEIILDMPDLPVEWFDNDSPFGEFDKHVLQ
jgi:hypothetical protein